MSLVAYASSDDESGSEQGEGETEREEVPISQNSEKVPDPPISDEEDGYAPISETSHSGLSLPAPRNEAVQNEPSVVEQKPENSNQGSFLSALPKPKAESGDNPEEEEIEDFVKKNTEKLKASVPIESKPKSHKRKIIKIAAPELHGSDSDEEQPKAKKSLPVSAASKKCGLFSVLPAPKNKSLGAGRETKENEGKMFADAFGQSKSSATNAKPSAEVPKLPLTAVKASVPFVPASLTRKPKQSSRSAFNLETGMMMAQARKKVPRVEPDALSDSAAEDAKSSASGESRSNNANGAMRLAGVPAYVDSSDDEGGEESGPSNFFSLGSSAAEGNPLSANSLSVTSSVSTLPSVGNKDSGRDDAAQVAQPSLQDQPLSFKPRDSGVQNAPLHFKTSTVHYQPGPSAGDMYNNAYYNMAGMSEGGVGAEGEGAEGQGQATEESCYPGGSFAQDEEFLKMQGKNKRGKEEINIIDVRQDDQMAEVDMNLIKNLSEENTNRMSYSKKKNDDMPTSQQRRKHQITYLAFKAKEREVDLKDAWAANRQTKRQTQSKYGF